MALIGIMGGTFNPIHLGHVNLAKAAYEQFKLDKVIFIPAGDPPHKKEQSVITGKHRMNMVNIAIRDYAYFEASDIEINREGYSYTYLTLKSLTEQNTQDKYYFIIGADSLFNLEKWYKPEEILQMCVMLVAVRNDIPQKEFLDKIEYFNKKFNADIRPLETPMYHISSSEIRNAFSDNKIDFSDNIQLNLLDDNVVEYIIENELYSCNKE